MATKYTTTLSADTSQHDKAIKKSANEIYKYKKNIDDAKKTLGTLVTKFGALGAAIGVGVGALSTFGTALKGIESVADSTARTQETLTYSIKQFFLSLSSGSFDSFLNGLGNIINKAKEAYNAIDSLRTFQSFNSADLARNLTKQNQLNLDIKNIKAGIIKDPDGTLLEQKQSELKTLQSERLNLVNQEIAHYDKAIKAQENKIQAQLKTPYAKELYQKYVKNGASYDEVEDATNAAKNAWIAIQAERAEAATMDDGQNLSIAKDREWYKNNKERFDRIHETYQVMLHIKNLEGEILSKKQLEIEKEKTKQDLIATKSSTIKALKESGIKTPITIAEVETEEELKDLLGEKRKQLSNLKTQLTNAVIMQKYSTNTENNENGIENETQKELSQLIKDLKEQYINLNNEIGDLEEDFNSIVESIEVDIIKPGSLKELENFLEYYEKLLDRAVYNDDIGGAQLYSSMIKSIEERIKNKKIELGLIDPDKVEEQVEEIKYTITDAYSAIMNLYGNINSLGDTLGDVFDSDGLREFFDTLNKGLSVVQAVYSVFESINKVMEISNALKAVSNKLTEEGTAAAVADTAAQTTDASANASNAIAGATKSGAKLPYPMNLIAIATGIAAVVGALSLMGSFADGGIVGGNTTVGDHGLARVNAGEMILNKREQTRLWHNLNGMGNINSGVSGDVVFKISGSDLVGTINNYNNKNRRVR